MGENQASVREAEPNISKLASIHCVCHLLSEHGGGDDGRGRRGGRGRGNLVNQEETTTECLEAWELKLLSHLKELGDVMRGGLEVVRVKVLKG